MQLPIVKPAPIVTTHTESFRHLFDNQCQFRHFQNYLTALMVLENKSLANISRCILESLDDTLCEHVGSLAPSPIGSSGKLFSRPIKTIGEVCRQQGQKLIEELILLAHDQLEQGQSAAEVCSRFFAKQRKEVIV
jgi:hypothetical protein